MNRDYSLGQTRKENDILAKLVCFAFLSTHHRSGLIDFPTVLQRDTLLGYTFINELFDYEHIAQSFIAVGSSAVGSIQ